MHRIQVKIIHNTKKRENNNLNEKDNQMIPTPR